MTRSWRHRVVLLLGAFLQLILPGAASIADARVEMQSARAARVHVESTSTSGCVPGHSGECTLCRVLSGLTGGTREIALPRRVALERCGAPGLSVVAPVATAAGDPAQRAPPSA